MAINKNAKPCPFCGCNMLKYGRGLNLKNEIIEKCQHPSGFYVYVSETDTKYNCPLSLLVFPVEAWNHRISKSR